MVSLGLLFIIGAVIVIATVLILRKRTPSSKDDILDDDF